MHDMARVRGDQSLRDLERIIGCLAGRQWALRQALAQRLAFQQLGNDIRTGAFDTDVVNRNNVGVIQSGGGASLKLESAQVVRILAGSRTDQFDGDIAFKPFVPRAEDFSHRARTYFFEDPVVPELASHKA